jgi:hypothetical protein
MCNLYSLTKGQAAIIALARAMRDRAGNMPPLAGMPWFDVDCPACGTNRAIDRGSRRRVASVVRGAAPADPRMDGAERASKTVQCPIRDAAKSIQCDFALRPNVKSSGGLSSGWKKQARLVGELGQDSRSVIRSGEV